jgi:RNA polymerase sigma-70 factor, ECF subfamily
MYPNSDSHSEAEAPAQQVLAGELMPLVYAELKRLASAQLRHERAGHTLSATALVHEAYLKLAGTVVANDRPQFLVLAARVMRHTLINHALAGGAAKRDGGLRISLAVNEVGEAQDSALELLSLDRALAQFEQHDPRAAKLAELRAFAGLSLEDAAAALDISIATAKRDWLYAKLWLKRAMQAE